MGHARPSTRQIARRTARIATISALAVGTLAAVGSTSPNTTLAAHSATSAPSTTSTSTSTSQAATAPTSSQTSQRTSQRTAAATTTAPAPRTSSTTRARSLAQASVSATKPMERGQSTSRSLDNPRILATTPSPAVASAPTPAPAPAQNPAPSSTGTSSHPSATTTGVPAGTRLTVHNGDINVTKAGTVLSGLDVRGSIKVNAPNVTIKNSIVRFREGGHKAGIQSYSTGLTITDVEVAPTVISPDYNGVMGSGFTLTRANIHRVVDSVHIYGNDVVIRDSWLHDNSHFVNDPNWGGKPSHDDSIQIVKGSRITITGNHYSGARNSGVQVTQDSGVVSHLTISKNFADGGGCTINLSEKGGGPLQAVSITSNKFGNSQRVAKCAIIKPSTTTVTASGNTWASTGAAVALSRG